MLICLDLQSVILIFQFASYKLTAYVLFLTLHSVLYKGALFTACSLQRSNNPCIYLCPLFLHCMKQEPPVPSTLPLAFCSHSKLGSLSDPTCTLTTGKSLGNAMNCKGSVGPLYQFIKSSDRCTGMHIGCTLA